MKKILYVFGGEKASGAEIVIDRLMRFNKQVEPHLFVSPGEFANKLLKEQPYAITMCPNLKKLNRVNTNAIKFVFVALKNYIATSYLVLRYISKNQIKTVHANTVVPASYLVPAIVMSRIFNMRINWLWSDHDINFFSKIDHTFATLNIRFFNVTLAVSYAVKKKYLNETQNSKVVVLYNGLDTSLFNADKANREAFRDKYEIEKDTVVIGIAGNLSVRKGQLELCKCVIELLKEIYNIKLILAGGTTDEDRKYADDIIDFTYKYPDAIIYIGKVNEMHAFYNGCDIIVNNSNSSGSEPLGTTIYEAMACKKIVIASDVGGSSEIIEDAKDGFLFEAENYQQLGELLTTCAKQISIYDHIRSSARKKVIDKFSVSKMADSYNEIVN